MSRGSMCKEACQHYNFQIISILLSKKRKKLLFAIMNVPFCFSFIDYFNNNECNLNNYRFVIDSFCFLSIVPSIITEGKRQKEKENLLNSFVCCFYLINIKKNWIKQLNTVGWSFLLLHSILKRTLDFNIDKKNHSVVQSCMFSCRLSQIRSSTRSNCPALHSYTFVSYL